MLPSYDKGYSEIRVILVGFKQIKKSLYLETFSVHFNLLQKGIVLLPLLKKIIKRHCMIPYITINFKKIRLYFRPMQIH